MLCHADVVMAITIAFEAFSSATAIRVRTRKRQQSLSTKSFSADFHSLAHYLSHPPVLSHTKSILRRLYEHFGCCYYCSSVDVGQAGGTAFLGKHDAAVDDDEYAMGDERETPDLNCTPHLAHFHFSGLVQCVTGSRIYRRLQRDCFGGFATRKFAYTSLCCNWLRETLTTFYIV